MNDWIARWVTCALCALVGCAECGDGATSPDAGVDADASVMDADDERGPGGDARPDFGGVVEPTCDLGDPCDPTRGCPTSPTCIAEMRGELGGTGDEILGCAGGIESAPVTSFAGGYCSTLSAIDTGGCDPDDEPTCLCEVCLATGQTSTTGSPITLCAEACSPSLTDNPCRDGYECVLGDDVCLPGCTSDLECQVRRTDTNGDGVLDVYDATTNPDGDRLTCETTVRAWCETATSRCRHEGTPGVEAGAECTDDFDCEADGDCLADSGLEGGFAGGYCIKRGCDVSGNDCAGAGKCQERGLGITACLKACEVAATDSTGDPFADHRDCRPGYSCFWDGSSGATADNGGCVPANTNDVRIPNIGAACASETECFSPYGLGRCRDFGGGRHCTLFDCAAPGMPADLCGDGAVCSVVTGSATSLCIATCEAAEDCLAGNGCWDTSVAGIETGGQRVCFPGCLEDGHCRAAERCEGASMTRVGTCTP